MRQARVKQPDAPLHRLGGGRGPELRGSKPGLCCSGWHDDLFLAAARCQPGDRRAQPAVTAASGGKVRPGQPVLSDPQTVNSPDMSKQSQNDLTGTVSRQPELEPAAAPIGGSRIPAPGPGG